VWFRSSSLYAPLACIAFVLSTRISLWFLMLNIRRRLKVKFGDGFSSTDPTAGLPFGPQSGTVR
jgi:hypothetical protein